MAYYTLTTPFTQNVPEFEEEAWKEARITQSMPGTCMSVQFSHIMAGGYAASASGRQSRMNDGTVDTSCSIVSCSPSAIALSALKPEHDV